MQNVFGAMTKVLVHLGQSVDEAGKGFLNIKGTCTHSQNVLSEVGGVEPCFWAQERGSWVFCSFKELNFDPLYSFALPLPPPFHPPSTRKSGQQCEFERIEAGGKTKYIKLC